MIRELGARDPPERSLAPGDQDPQRLSEGAADVTTLDAYFRNGTEPGNGDRNPVGDGRKLPYILLQDFVQQSHPVEKPVYLFADVVDNTD